MILTLYQFSKKSNSTAIPGSGVTSHSCGEIYPKDKTSLESPVFQIDYNPTGYTYAKWGNYYYFITDIVYSTPIYEIHCEMDPLATYKSDILAHNAKVLYSSSDYDEDIPDSRIAFQYEYVYKRVTATSNPLPTWFSPTVAHNGTFIIKNISNDLGVATPTCGVWYTNYTNVVTYLNYIAGNVSNIHSAIQNYVTDVAHATLGIEYTPYIYTPTGSTTISIVASNTGALGDRILSTNIVSDTATLTLPSYTYPARWMACKSKIVLYLPYVGYVNLDPREVMTGTRIIIDISFNINDGVLVYQLWRGESTDPRTAPLGRYEANMKVQLPVAGTDILSARVNLGMAANVALGNLANGISSSMATGSTGSVIGAGISQALNASTLIGSARTDNLLVATDGDVTSRFKWSQDITLYAIFDESVEGVSSLASHITLQGAPCMRTRALSGLSGYCQTSGFSFSGNVLGAIRDRINTLMDGGVYIE